MAKFKYNEEHLTEQLYDRYQRMIRHPDYRSFCDKFKQYFDRESYSNLIKYHIKLRNPIPPKQKSDGHLSFNCPDENDDHSAYHAFTQIRKQFGTTWAISHYSEPLSKKDMLACPPFEHSMAFDSKPLLEKGSEPSNEEHMTEQLYERYQQMIQHPDYRSFCDKYYHYFDRDEYSNIVNHFIKLRNPIPPKQKSDGYLSFNCPDKNDNPLAYKAFNAIRKQFGTTGVITHYNAPLSKEDMLACSPFERSLAVDFKSRLEDGNELNFVHEGHYLHADIDISPDIPIDQILEEIKSFIKHGRSEIGEEGKRNHLKRSNLKYMVWDLRYERVPFSEIGIQLNIPRQTASSIFRSAWLDILGEKYSPEMFQRTFDEHCLREKNYAKLMTKDDSVESKYISKNTTGYDQEINGDSDQYNPFNQAVIEDYNFLQLSGGPEESNQYLVEYCGSCSDLHCSKAMVTALKGSFNFHDATPCQKLYNLLITPSSEWPPL